MPKPLKINTPEITREPETVTVAFDLDLAGGVAQFSYRIKDATVQPQKLGEALVSASLLLAMTEGRDIECEIPPLEGIPCEQPQVPDDLQPLVPRI